MYTDGTSLQNNPTWQEEDSPWKAVQICKVMDRNALAPRTIGEIGCGAGEILNRLSKDYGDNTEFFDYEISPEAYEICFRKSRPNLKYELSDPVTDDSIHFDVLLAIDVFEHVEDYLGFLRKLRPKADYKIFHIPLGIPLDLSVQTVLRSGPILGNRRNVGHLHYFTKETALATLNDTGYQIIDYFYTGGSVELPNRGWKSNLQRLPRKAAFLLNRDLAVRILGGYSLLVLAK